MLPQPKSTTVSPGLASRAASARISRAIPRITSQSPSIIRGFRRRPGSLVSELIGWTVMREPPNASVGDQIRPRSNST